MTTSARLLAFLLLVGLWGIARGQGSPLADPAAARPAEAPKTPAPPANEIQIRIEQLIQQLGDERFETREAASASLAKIGGRARPALEMATQSTDAEVALRAKAILAALPKLTHTIVDALGQPIPQAEVAITTVVTALPPPGGLPGEESQQRVTLVSEEDGRIGIPETSPETRVSVSVTVRHQEYGLARCNVDLKSGDGIVRFPLVRRGTAAHRRAITGQLAAADGTPVVGAIVRCSDVRTPGEGLIEGTEPRGEALSDEEGHFTYYLPPSEVRREERGVLIPANSRYGLTFRVPNDDTFVPWAGRYSNIEPVHIELPRANREYRFRFESASGGFIRDEKQLRQVRVQFDRMQDGERLLIDLGQDVATAKRKLLPGKYLAESFMNGKTIAYLPLIVTEDSPEELTFSLPHAVTYRGRVVDGVNGDPVSGAWIMAFNSTSRNNLALLTAENWKLLQDTPSNPPPDHPAIMLLGEHYGVQGLVRTDRDGRFEIIRQPDQEFYGLLAFSADVIPYNVSLGALKPDEKHTVDTGEYPLFPAAKIMVRPVFDRERLAVSPRWFPAEQDQPEWFARFQAASKTYERQLEYIHWLKLNERQPVFVPAGLRLQVRFESPYDDKWAPAVVEGLRLEAKATKEIGDVRFAANLPITVRVLDPQGVPVEGAPIRQMYQGDNAWSVAHNTDAEGLARFYARHNSEGRFWISDLPGPKEARSAENLFAHYKVENESPPQPITITITRAQAELLLGPRKGLQPK